MKRRLLLVLCVAAAAGFFALGVWQLQRRTWKLDLIARVESRVHAAPVSLPPSSAWPTIDAPRDEYRHVRLAGSYLHERTTLVDALTDRGAGAWVMTPLRTGDGIVMVNRGFVPPEHRQDYDRPQGDVSLTGLLRTTEPGGRFLRPNRPQDDAWYSRDVAAMAAARTLDHVAPFFVDADATAGATYPVSGLTVVRFRNTHLVYALTWFALAAMACAGAWQLARRRD